ncbi:MAG: cytochrome c peroxidase [Planctomycetota bacterium]|jgi:cytochrome c peroxidase
MNNKPLFFIVLCIVLFSFKRSKDKLINAPKYFGSPVYNFKENPLSKEKILLGRALFHDPLLSDDKTISCTSCHSQYNAFTHTDHNLSHGIHDSIGKRNSPALMNLAWQNSFMWDGSIHYLDVQSLGPISSKSEMGSSIDTVVQRLSKSDIYRSLFKKAYGSNEVTGEKTLKAITAFMLTFVSANSKYDKVKRNETSYTKQEENGYLIFQKNCNSCHAEPLFTNHGFETNGLPIDSNLKDLGRMTVTKNAIDSLKFKIPTLRNIEFSYPYMHDGRFDKLSEVINHYTSESKLNKSLNIVLTEKESVDLLSFLLCLSDKEFLFNKKFNYPREVLLN